MLPSPCHLLADVHLGVAPQATERALVRWLRMLPSRGGSLVIGGDLFDFWFEWQRVIPRTGFRVLAALADVVESGIPVVWVAGNHDCWGGAVLRDDLGIDYRLEPWEGTLAGWQARVAHGDGMRGRADRGYRAIRPVLRHRLSQWAFRHLPPDAATRLAVGSSQASRTYRPADDGLELRRVAVATLQADPALELLVLGHSHVAGLERAPSGGVYANPGSWLDAPTYLMVEPGSIALCRWDGSAEGDRVHVLDRGPEKAPGHT